MFKDKLKQLRTEHNLTQADVANALGVSSATIGNYEQGTREPRNHEMWQKLPTILMYLSMNLWIIGYPSLIMISLKKKIKYLNWRTRY